MNKAIKGFNKDLRCRGIQFALGETCKHDGDVVACESGFHVITGHPLSVFNYYPPASSRFAVVEIGGATDSDDDDEKTAAEILSVGVEIGLQQLTEAAVQWVMDRARPDGEVSSKPNGAATASGDQGAAICTAPGGMVRGKTDGVDLFAREFEFNDSTGRLERVSIACGTTGENGIKADVWYRCIGGKLVEVNK